jgi:hypothetical protein
MQKPNRHLQRSRRCMDPGALGAFVEEFTSHLKTLGHTRLTVRGYGDAARHFAEWLRRSDIAVVDVRVPSLKIRTSSANVCTRF